ncbi:MAG: PH domain-containing protein, partial [Candidatus Methanomethylophilaceae archaeon]
MTEDRVFRNHPSVILRNVVSACLFIGLMVLLNVGSAMEVEGWIGYVVIILVAVAAIVALISYYIWRKTTYTFTSEEIVIRVDTAFKKVNRIQYSKLASVNVRRNILNHLFGTAVLMFNVNSSVNAQSAEGTLTLKKEIADRLRDELNSMIFQKEITLQEDLQVPTAIHISNLDIILHGFLAQPTVSSIFGLLTTIYAIVMIFFGSSGGILSALFLFFVGEVIPIATSILKYYNYRIYRVEDTITIECGMINNYRSSFKVNKVNSVRIREPLLARAFRMATLEAEVVGLAGEEAIPILCPLKRRLEVEALFRNIIPEFCDDGMEPVHQPRAALVPMIIGQVLLAVIVVPMLYVLYRILFVELNGYDGFIADLISFGVIAAMVVSVVLMVGYVSLAQSHRMFALGKDVFLFVHGSFDVNVEYI